MAAPENIHPTFGQLLGRESKETLLKQRGTVVWLYGLSGSGKSTLANALAPTWGFNGAGRKNRCSA